MIHDPQIAVRRKRGTTSELSTVHSAQGICKAKEETEKKLFCFSYAQFQYCGTPHGKKLL